MSQLKTRRESDVIEYDFTYFTQTTQITNDQEQPAETISYSLNSPVYFFFKRFIDIFGSLLGIVIFLIPMVIIAIAIKLSSKGPVIFKQERMGRNLKPFICYKFRTMSTDAPSCCASAELESAESYITRVGYVLRKLSLDEIPQLFNILFGSMSFIGPRPVVLTETDLIEKRAAAGVYLVRPGLSGWAQINGRDMVDVDKKVELDFYYAQNESFSLDAKIFLLSIIYSIKRSGIHEGSFEDESVNEKELTLAEHR